MKILMASDSHLVWSEMHFYEMIAVSGSPEVGLIDLLYK